VWNENRVAVLEDQRRPPCAPYTGDVLSLDGVASSESGIHFYFDTVDIRSVIETLDFGGDDTAVTYGVVTAP